jgi:lysine 2,3-aminomutase
LQGRRRALGEGLQAYISERPELEDIVVSGGDAYNLRAEQLRHIGETLVKMENIRRIRIATKGPAVMPQKILTDHEWLDAVTHVVDLGRKLHKEVVLHTHFNHPNEITGITRDAMLQAVRARHHVRNQSVISAASTTPRDDAPVGEAARARPRAPVLRLRARLVKGAEDLRTTVQTAIGREARARLDGGFNTPTFVVDAPGGGGKRDATRTSTTTGRRASRSSRPRA